MASVANVLDPAENVQEEIKFAQGPVYKRIPKASRLHACTAFRKILQNIIDKNDWSSWMALLYFARSAIGSSVRGGKKHKSQATIVNKRIEEFMAGNSFVTNVVNSSKKPWKAPSMKNLVSAKMAVGDITGAVRIISSNDTVLPQNLETLEKLKERHPQSHQDAMVAPNLDEENSCFKTNKDALLKSLSSFKNGILGGPDGLTPQHLIDMCGEALGESATKLVDTIVTFMNLIVFPGKVPPGISDTFYDANLTALSKPDSGVRPIAIGFTLRHLAAKLAMFALKDFCQAEFRPNQLGVGTPKGMEAAVHSLRSYVLNPQNNDTMIKSCLKSISRMHSIQSDMM